MTKAVHCIYLHGFASGPSSSKAVFFSNQLRQLGLTVDVPDLNGNSFSDLTLTGQLQLVTALAEQRNHDSDLILLGSSMGGLLSTMLADKLPAVRAIVLFAPGFGLNKRWHELLGVQQLQAWRDEGELEVFHHAANKKLPLKYGFIEDAERHQTDNLRVHVPSLVLHGAHDDVVPVEESRNFSKENSEFVELHVLDSDHGLLNVMPQMWSLIEQFLQRTAVLTVRNR